MDFITQIKNYAFKYQGIDWLVALTVFIGVFLLGDKKKLGFIAGMMSSTFGLIFSFQIGSVANGLTSIILFFLYLRGYLNWKKLESS